MRHRKKKGSLGRRTAWRKATLKSLANDLFIYQRIRTTETKAKVLRSFAEPLITLAKKNPDSINARRAVFSRLSDRSVVKILFEKIAPLYKDTPGGYTRVMQLGTRKGDGARMAVIELVKRTISDEDLLGALKEKAKTKVKGKIKSAREVSKEKEAPVEPKEGEKPHVVPEVDIEEKEERVVEDVKKEKAKTEQKKITKIGFFKRFQRKSMG